MAAVSAVSAVPAETTGGNGAGAYRCGADARAAGTAGGAVAEDDALSTVAGGPAGTTVVAGADDAVGDGARVTAGPTVATVTGVAELDVAARAAGAAGPAIVAGGDGAVGEGSSCPSGSAGGTVTTCSEDAGAAFAAGAAGGTVVAGVDRAVLDSSAGTAVSAGTALATGAKGERWAGITAVTACPAVVARGHRARLAQGPAVAADPTCSAGPAGAQNPPRGARGGRPRRPPRCRRRRRCSLGSGPQGSRRRRRSRRLRR